MEDQVLFLGHISYNINQSRCFLGHISCKLIDLIVVLVVATREAMLRSLYLSILVCLRWTKQINLLFSLWQIIHSYLWTFQYIHVRNSLYVFYIFVCAYRNVLSTPVSFKDREEKAKRSEFVQGLLLSTILDDILWRKNHGG